MNADKEYKLKCLLSTVYLPKGDVSYRLSSGQQSSEYIDVKKILGNGWALNTACEWMETFVVGQYVGGPSIPAALLVGGLITRQAIEDYPMYGFVIRPKRKPYGTEKQIEGILPITGTPVTLVEDVITSGQSVLTSAKILETAGYPVGEICALVDRESGGPEMLRKLGYTVYTFCTISEIREVYNELAIANP